jgi:hypothetical protein
MITFTAKFQSKCANCGGVLTPGQKAKWGKTGPEGQKGKAVHFECGGPSTSNPARVAEQTKPVLTPADIPF